MSIRFVLFILFHSKATHCPDGNCPEGQVCYGGTTCNAFDMTHQPTLSPTKSPTPAPTQKPTGPTQVSYVYYYNPTYMYTHLFASLMVSVSIIEPYFGTESETNRSIKGKPLVTAECHPTPKRLF
jgi:hypothetical protein